MSPKQLFLLLFYEIVMMSGLLSNQMLTVY